MKFQDLFSLKNKKNNKKLSSAAFVIGSLKVKGPVVTIKVILSKSI